MSYKKRAQKKFEYESTPEKTDPKSLTIPDMAIDLKQTLAQMAGGIEPKKYIPYYQSDEDPEFKNDMPQFEKMSKLERLQWAADKKEEIGYNLQEYKKKFLEKQKAYQEAKIQERIKAAQAEEPKESKQQTDGAPAPGAA